MSTERIITIPNALTVIRICLVPLFVFTMNVKDYSFALKILILAGITDSLDGIIARKLNQISKLGIFLDPLADKLLLLSLMITFYFHDLVPKWFLMIVFTRDFLVAFGWLEAYLRKKRLIKPLLLGKISNALQVIVFSYVLFSLNFNLPKMPTIFFIALSVISVLSFIQYAIERFNNETKGT